MVNHSSGCTVTAAHSLRRFNAAEPEARHAPADGERRGGDRGDGNDGGSQGDKISSDAVMMAVCCSGPHVGVAIYDHLTNEVSRCLLVQGRFKAKKLDFVSWVPPWALSAPACRSQSCNARMKQRAP
jgi:hypothetical protein